MAQAGFTPISLYHSSTAAAEPTAGNLINGELAINIADGKLYYKDNLGVVKSISGATATYTRTSFTATAAQTTFTVAYTVGFVQVYLNGVFLNGTDFTATNGTTVVLATGATAGDIVEVVAYNVVNIGVASTANNLAGGIASQIPYQSSAGTTAFIANGTSGQALVSNGTSAPGFGTLGVAGGGTGATTSGAAPFALKGANADITSLTGLTTALSVAQGGTGAATLTANNVLLGNGTSALQAVAPGANGNLLVSNGTTWTSSAPAGGGSLIFLSAVIASNAGTVDVETTFSSTYDEYLLFADGVIGQPTFGGNMRIRLKYFGSYVTGGYNYNTARYVDSNSTPNINVLSSGGAFIDTQIAPSENPDTGLVSFVCRIASPVATGYKAIEMRGVATNSVGSSTRFDISGANANQTSAIEGIRFYISSGNMSGNFRLYGVKKS
jgi:hypothetical protein